MYKGGIFKKMLSIIPTEYLEFCCIGPALSVIYSANLLKLLIFIKKILYHEYSRHKRPVSVTFDLFTKISRQYFILRGNVVIEL